MNENVEHGKGRDDPGRIPMDRRRVIAGQHAEIEHRAADDQRRDCNKENPGQQHADRTQPRLFRAEQPAQPRFVEPDATAEAASQEIDGICDGHADQHHRRLDMRRPHIGARQYRIEQVEPGAVRRFRRDPQPADKGNADGADQQPMQDNGPVVGLARLHRRLPVGGAQPAQHETLFKQRTLLRNYLFPRCRPASGRTEVSSCARR